MLSKSVLSRVDHKKDVREDMRYLKQPRGPGKSWVFRMMTPSDLVGVPSPWDGKPLPKEIKKGLGTRHLPEARKLRDIALGDIRRLQDDLSDGEAFSLASAVEWREAVTADRRAAEDPRHVGVELVLTDNFEAAEARGLPRDRLKRFARVATGNGFPFDLAHSQYVEARSPDNPYGYKRRLFGFIGLRRKQLWFLILEPQTAHQLGGTRGAVALTIFRQNKSADRIGIPGWMLGKMSLQNLFLFHRQVPLALAVVLQTEERQPCTSKREPPFCQNAWADVQNPANRPGIFSSVQKKKCTRTFPNKGIYLAAAADRFKRYALFVDQGNCLVLLAHALTCMINSVWPCGALTQWARNSLGQFRRRSIV